MLFLCPYLLRDLGPQWTSQSHRTQQYLQNLLRIDENTRKSRLLQLRVQHYRTCLSHIHSTSVASLRSIHMLRYMLGST